MENGNETIVRKESISHRNIEVMAMITVVIALAVIASKALALTVIVTIRIMATIA